MAFVPPVIVVPGITATYLRDDYPLPPETVWSVLTNDYGRVAMHPDNPQYEAIEPARLQQGQVYEVAYKELINELRYNLRTKEDKPVPVFAFGYDWRQPLDWIELQLAAFVDEVIERTKLLKHYYDAGFADNPRVNLVGHSMGGMIIAGYLERRGADARVAKVATLATPYQGSYEAVIKVATGTANLGTNAPSSREREAARLTPALYHLLPSINNGIDFAPGLPKTLFELAAWQPSVLQTLQEFVRLHGVILKDPKSQAQNLFGAMLQRAREHRERIEGLTLNKAGLKPNDWLCIVGVGTVTRIGMRVDATPKGPDFVFDSSVAGKRYRDDKWADGATPEERRRTGDGTVPFDGALPKFLPLESLVCVTPNDYGYWEVQDKMVSAAAGFHGILPNMDMLHRLLVRHFTGRPDTRNSTWGRPPPGVTDAQWAPPVAGLWNKQREQEGKSSPAPVDRPGRT